MKLRWRFPVTGLPLVNSVLRFARQFVAPPMLSRSQPCAEEKERRNLFDQVSVHTYRDSSENWKFFFPFKAFRHQKCRFSKNGLQSGVFSCKRLLVRDLSECTKQDGRKKRTTKRLGVTNVTGLLLACFVVIFTYYFMFSGLLQKDQFKGKWSLVKSYFKTKLL